MTIRSFSEIERARGLFLPFADRGRMGYACRAGTTTPFYFGETVPPVFLPMRGDSDMHGNVWEWCADWYGDYPPGEILDPQGPQGGDCRVLRGGSFLPGFFVRSGDRNREWPTIVASWSAFVR